MLTAKGRGSVTKLEDKPRARCRKWRLRVSFGTDQLTGKRKESQKRFSGTYSDAQEALRNFMVECDNESLTSDRNISFAKFAIKWRDERRITADVAKGTLRKDDLHVRIICRLIGNVRLADVTPDTVAGIYTILRTPEGTISGKPLSGTSARSVAVTLNHIMADAVIRGIIKVNPCANVTRPKIDTEEKTALSKEQAKALAEKLMDGDPDPRKIAVLVASACGMRREEVLGLSWDNFNADAPSLTVWEVLTAESRDLVKPKTADGRRTMPIHQTLAQQLTNWKSTQAEMMASCGVEQTPRTPIVTSAALGRVHPNNFYRWWIAWSKDNGFAGVGMHQLRHTFATFLMANNVDIITGKKLMGQADPKMLMKIYAHAVNENMSNAVESVGDDLFS